MNSRPAQRASVNLRHTGNRLAEARAHLTTVGKGPRRIMALQTESTKINIEMAAIAGTPLQVSRVAIGTWAIGGWMWGGTDEGESIATIRSALDHGINVIDTAPAYGFGRSEEIVGTAIAEGGLRSDVVIATKVGLEWRDGQVVRNASRRRVLREIEESLRRLRTDHIDIYQV